MPWDYRPWGCGSGKKGSCNNGWIQFEICEDNKKNEDYFNEVYWEACEITAYLCKLYHIDPLGTADCGGVTVPTILCHQDSYKLGLGSNHSDIYDWFKRYGKDMNTVRKDVANLLKNEALGDEEGTHASSDNLVFVDNKNEDDHPEGISLQKNPPFLARVIISDLQIYTGPGDHYPKSKRNTGKGTFTIMEVKMGNGSSSGWGLLKAYADKRNGWINLDHVTIR